MDGTPAALKAFRARKNRMFFRVSTLLFSIHLIVYIVLAVTNNFPVTQNYTLEIKFNEITIPLVVVVDWGLSRWFDLLILPIATGAIIYLIPDPLEERTGETKYYPGLQCGCFISAAWLLFCFPIPIINPKLNIAFITLLLILYFICTLLNFLAFNTKEGVKIFLESVVMSIITAGLVLSCKGGFGYFLQGVYLGAFIAIPIPLLLKIFIEIHNYLIDLPLWERLGDWLRGRSGKFENAQSSKALIFRAFFIKKIYL